MKKSLIVLVLGLCAFLTINQLRAECSLTGPNMCFSPCCDVNCSLGFTAGYGRLCNGGNALISSSLAAPLISQLLNTQERSGGWSWRLYANCLFDINTCVSLGGELGFTHYPKSRFGQSLSITVTNPTIDISQEVVSKGYGTDVLLDIIFFPCRALAFGVKPGFQFASQKNEVSTNLLATLSLF